MRGSCGGAPCASGVVRAAGGAAADSPGVVRGVGASCGAAPDPLGVVRAVGESWRVAPDSARADDRGGAGAVGAALVAGDRRSPRRVAGRASAGSCVAPAEGDGRPLRASSARRTGPGRGVGGGGACRGARRSAGRAGCTGAGAATRCIGTHAARAGGWPWISCARAGGGAEVAATAFSAIRRFHASASASP
jgi:hypothetical protein